MSHILEFDLAVAIDALHDCRSNGHWHNDRIVVDCKNGILVIGLKGEHLTHENRKIVKEFVAPFVDEKALQPRWHLCSYVVALRPHARAGLEAFQRQTLKNQLQLVAGGTA